ncbi:LacI family DNA-binding transcriptional regulator [Enterobacter hormaechei]
MDKRLKITEIAARTQLSISTVSRVLAGKANTSEKARAKVLACARELGVMDGMAAGTISALQNHGLRVPHDVSVMSIDGFNLAAIQDVPLTAVHVPRDELGTEAVHMLQQRLMRPDAPVGTLLLNGTLTVRESVRRIRQGKRRTAVEREGLYDG